MKFLKLKRLRERFHEQFFGAPLGDDPLASLNRERRCPDCGSALFHRGPRGGDALNVMCAGCGNKFWYAPPFTPQRIGNEDGVYDLSVRRKLEDM